MTPDQPPEQQIDRLARGISIIRDVVRTLTSDAGVYRMLNEKGDILYIGKAKNLLFCVK